MDIVLRIGLIYVAIMIGLRVMGKRDLGKLSPFDLVTLMMIPEIVSQALVGEDFSVTAAMIGLATLFVLVFFTSAISHRYVLVRKAVEGSPTVLVCQGAFLVRQMDRERVQPEELFAEMHKAGLEELRQVKWAILETDGTISIIPMRQEEKQIKPRGDALAVT
jgi:uncharacterized membrane protein YcaP (DUF421 family)